MGNSNPSETLISIKGQYNVNLNWLLTYVDSKDEITYEDYYEKRLLLEDLIAIVLEYETTN